MPSFDPTHAHFKPFIGLWVIEQLLHGLADPIGSTVRRLLDGGHRADRCQSQALYPYLRRPERFVVHTNAFISQFNVTLNK